MAFPTQSVSKEYARMTDYMLATKAFCQRRSTEMGAGNVASTTIIDCAINLRQAEVALTAIGAAAATTGLVAYAQAQANDDQLDVVTEFNAVVAAITAAKMAAVAVIPLSSGYLLARTWSAEGPVDRQFSTGETANLRAALDAMAATIN